MSLDVWFFDPLIIPNATSKTHMMLQLCLNYTDLLIIEHSFIWYDLFLHRISIGRDITDQISVKYLFFL